MKKIKVGIVGLGRIAHMGHIKELSALPEKFEITAVCDNAPERLENLVPELKNVRKYTSLDDMLKDDNVDMVNICVRHLEHVPMALKILEAGKIAVVEKPVAVNLKEFDALVAAAQKNPEKLFLRHNRRFEMGFTKAKQLINSGVIGDVQYIKLYRSVGFCRRNDWMTMPEFYGGLLSNWGPHLIDHALQFLNYQVDSVWSELKLLAAQGDAEDSVKIIMRGKDGLTVDIEIYGGNALAGNAYEVYGTRGALHSSDEQDIKLRYIEPDYELKPYPVNEGHPNGFIFADNAQLPWRRMTVMTEPKLKVDMNSCYRYVALNLLEGQEYPIKVAEALEVVKICDIVKSQSPFYNSGK